MDNRKYNGSTESGRKEWWDSLTKKEQDEWWGGLFEQGQEKKWWDGPTKQEEKDDVDRNFKLLFGENYCCPYFCVVQYYEREERYVACQLLVDTRHGEGPDNAYAAFTCMSHYHLHCPIKEYFIEKRRRQGESKAIMGDTSIEELEKMWEIINGTSKTTD